MRKKRAIRDKVSMTRSEVADVRSLVLLRC